MAWVSLSAVTFTALVHHAERGLRRSLVSPPSSRSKVQATSLAVKGWPSCHFTPSRRTKTSFLLSSFQSHFVARSGTTVSRLFLGACWSNITKLL